MMSQNFPEKNSHLKPNKYLDGDIDLINLLQVLWSGRIHIMLFGLVFTLFGASFAFLKPNIYEASVRLTPAHSDSNFGGMAAQLGGLASLAGLNVSQYGDKKAVIAKEVLSSHAFLSDFIRRHKLEKPLRGAKAWDHDTEEWVINEDLINPETGEWRLDEDGESLAPTDWELVKKFRKDHLSIKEDRDTGMMSVKVSSRSPVAAKIWSELLINDLNNNLRERDVTAAERRIAYLEQKLAQVEVAGMQQVFYQLIESEMRTVMLANAEEDYALRVVDPPVIPEEKVAPNRLLIVCVAIIIGFVIGSFYVLLKTYLS